MKRWIDDGTLGALTGCSIACRSSGLMPDAEGRYPYIERQPYVRREARLMIAEVLIHRLDVARWLCGPLALVAARARRSCAEVIGETEATLLFEATATRMAVVVDGNFGCAGYPAQSVDRVEIAGTRARVEMDRDVLRLHGPQPAEMRYDPVESIQQSFDRTMQHFIACLRSGERFRNEIDNNLDTLRLVDEAYHAAGPRYADLS
jgi:predicted dehydrogenase